MLRYKEIGIEDIDRLLEIYIDTFNAPPWNDKWTKETAGKRLRQMINVEDFYGISAYKEDLLYGMILGSKEQFFDGVKFNIKEFCVRNDLRGQGVGTKILCEFENRLKEQGVNEIVLFTIRTDVTEGFYLKKGLKAYNDMVMMGKQLQ